MNIYLIEDSYRVDGVTGRFVEADLDAALPVHDTGIELVGARNGFVSFQVVLDARAEGRIGHAEVSVSPLRGEVGTLPPDAEVFAEWFHTVKGACIPDLLLPVGSVCNGLRVPQSGRHAPNQRVGAFWVDLFVAKDAVPGRYEGEVTVRADGVEKTLKLGVEVLRAAIPTESLMIADLNSYADAISPAFPKLRSNPHRYHDGSYLAVERQFYRMAREHRCVFEHLNAPHSGMPPDTFAPELEGAGKRIRVKSWDAYDEHYGPYLDGSAFRGSRRGEYPIEFLFTPFNLGWPANYEKWGTKGYATEYRRILFEYQKHFEEKGWTKTYLETQLNNKKNYRFFPTTQDEIWYWDDEDVLRQFFEIQGDIPKLTHAKMVFRCDESNNLHRHYDNDLGEHIDLWVANQTMYAWCPECVNAIHNRGQMLWHYGWYGEGFTLDTPLLAHFVQPMVSYMTGSTGFCSFWNCLGFGRDPLDCPFVEGGQAIFYPGTGIPGAPDVLPSLRLKALRNHMQLADLMMTVDGTELEANPAWKTEVQKRINAAFGYADSKSWWVPKPDFVDKYPPRDWDYVAPNYGDYTPIHHPGHSPMLIPKLREEILRLLDKAPHCR